MVEKPQSVKIGKPTDIERIKISILGDGSTGKSSIAKRFCEGIFEKEYNPTIAVDYAIKALVVNGVNVNVNIWDFSGHPEFFEVRNEFYRDTDAIILVYDVTSSKSFQGLDQWVNEASKYGATSCVISVCGNKYDEAKKSVSATEATKWSKSRSYNHYEVSAKEGTNVDNMFNEIIKAILAAKKKK